MSKSPFEKLSMEKAFDQAAKGLPENVKRIYGGDGGEWIGIKNEAVDSVVRLQRVIRNPVPFFGPLRC